MLRDDLKTALGTAFVFYVKTAGFHWNVEGPDFPQYHKFLGKIYEDVQGSIDKLAELIRQLDEYAPGNLSRMVELSVVDEQPRIPRAELMIEELYSDNIKILDQLKATFIAAEAENQQGIADFIAGRIDAHGKFAWMLRSTLKKARA